MARSKSLPAGLPRLRDTSLYQPALCKKTASFNKTAPSTGVTPDIGDISHAGVARLTGVQWPRDRWKSLPHSFSDPGCSRTDEDLDDRGAPDNGQGEKRPNRRDDQSVEGDVIKQISAKYQLTTREPHTLSVAPLSLDNAEASLASTPTTPPSYPPYLPDVTVLPSMSTANVPFKAHGNQGTSVASPLLSPSSFPPPPHPPPSFSSRHSSLLFLLCLWATFFLRLRALFFVGTFLPWIKAVALAEAESGGRAGSGGGGGGNGGGGRGGDGHLTASDMTLALAVIQGLGGFIMAPIIGKFLDGVGKVKDVDTRRTKTSVKGK